MQSYEALVVSENVVWTIDRRTDMSKSIFLIALIKNICTLYGLTGLLRPITFILPKLKEREIHFLREFGLKNNGQYRQILKKFYIITSMRMEKCQMVEKNCRYFFLHYK